MESFFANTWEVFAQVSFWILVESYLTFLCKFVAFSPLVFFGSAKDLENAINLIKLTGAWEKRVLKIHFTHNTPCGKNVRVKVIMMGPQDTFWSSVPPGRYIRSVRPTLNSRVLASSEINDFCHQRVFVDHDIVRFQISMQYA